MLKQEQRWFLLLCLSLLVPCSYEKHPLSSFRLCPWQLLYFLIREAWAGDKKESHSIGWTLIYYRANTNSVGANRIDLMRSKMIRTCQNSSIVWSSSFAECLLFRLILFSSKEVEATHSSQTMHSCVSAVVDIFDTRTRIENQIGPFVYSFLYLSFFTLCGPKLSMFSISSDAHVMNQTEWNRSNVDVTAALETSFRIGTSLCSYKVKMIAIQICFRQWVRKIKKVVDIVTRLHGPEPCVPTHEMNAINERKVLLIHISKQ